MRFLYSTLVGIIAAWPVASFIIDPQALLVSTSSTSDSISPLLSLHKALCEVESITENEAPVTEVLVKYLQNLGLTVERQEVSEKRWNILAYKGSRRTKVLVSSHIDTVPPYWPYERRGDEIWGRGTVDAKGSVAAQIIAFESLLAGGDIKSGDVALLYVVGEEVDGEGMRKANDLGLSWESVIFGEPTELRLASGHKGTLAFKLSAKGKAGHSGYPELGRSANSMLVSALHQLEVTELPWSEKFGNSTLNIGRVEGGVAANVIAEDAFAKLIVRIADGTPENLKGIIEDAVAKAGYGDDIVIQYISAGYGPIDIDHDIKGFGDNPITVNYGTDIPNLNGDHKKYLYGPGDILVAHSDHEHLKVSDLQVAVDGYRLLIKHALHGSA